MRSTGGVAAPPVPPSNFPTGFKKSPLQPENVCDVVTPHDPIEVTQGHFIPAMEATMNYRMHLRVCATTCSLIIAISLSSSIHTAAQSTFFGAGGNINSAAPAVNVALGYNALVNNTGTSNTAVGYSSLYNNIAGSFNCALGFNTLNYNTSGNYNTAVGFSALYFNNTGYGNTGLGYSALTNNTTGYGNTGTGLDALNYNTIGAHNTATGFNSMYANTTGYSNTAVGSFAMTSNTSGSDNEAFGENALYNNVTGYENLAFGSNALAGNLSGFDNSAVGDYALYANTEGNYNMASGYASMYRNTTGLSNTAYGYESLYSNVIGNWNTAYGPNALYLSTGNNNIALGYGSGQNIATGSNNIAIGNSGASTDSGVIRIGTTSSQTATFIAGINGVTAAGGVPVIITPSGQLGTVTSSARFKFDVHSLGAVSDRLMSLRPVTFRYKESSPDGSHPVQYGLIAEEVAKVYPDLVQYDSQGKPFTVYYHLLTPMMLNELQKAHRQAETQEAEIQSLKSEVAAMRSTLLSAAKSPIAPASKQSSLPLPVIFGAMAATALVSLRRKR